MYITKLLFLLHLASSRYQRVQKRRPGGVFLYSNGKRIIFLPLRFFSFNLPEFFFTLCDQLTWLERRWTYRVTNNNRPPRDFCVQKSYKEGRSDWRKTERISLHLCAAGWLILHTSLTKKTTGIDFLARVFDFYFGQSWVIFSHNGRGREMFTQDFRRYTFVDSMSYEVSQIIRMHGAEKRIIRLQNRDSLTLCDVYLPRQWSFSYLVSGARQPNFFFFSSSFCCFDCARHKKCEAKQNFTSVRCLYVLVQDVLLAKVNTEIVESSDNDRYHSITRDAKPIVLRCRRGWWIQKVVKTISLSLLPPTLLIPGKCCGLFLSPLLISGILFSSIGGNILIFKTWKQAK